MDNLLKTFLTDLKDRLNYTISECLTEQTKNVAVFSTSAELHAHRLKLGWKPDKSGNLVPPPKTKIKTTRVMDSTTTQQIKSRGESGFNHANAIGAHLGTAVLKTHRSSGQQEHQGFEGVHEIVTDEPTGPHQKKIYFGERKARVPFQLHADLAAPRHENDTARYSYTTSIASKNGADGVIKTHIWDHGSSSWKTMSHELEYGQGSKQWIRRNVTSGGVAKQANELQLARGKALDELVPLGKITTWGEVKAKWGKDTTEKIAGLDTHLIHFNRGTSRFSVVRIRDMHDNTPLRIHRENRSAEKDRKSSVDSYLGFDVGKLMEFQQRRGVGKHDLTADEVLQHFTDLHRSTLQQPIKEWVCSYLRDRGIII
jgi:hypothetical protein